MHSQKRMVFRTSGNGLILQTHQLWRRYILIMERLQGRNHQKKVAAAMTLKPMQIPSQLMRMFLKAIRMNSMQAVSQSWRRYSWKSMYSLVILALFSYWCHLERFLSILFTYVAEKCEQELAYATILSKWTSHICLHVSTNRQVIRTLLMGEAWSLWTSQVSSLKTVSLFQIWAISMHVSMMFFCHHINFLAWNMLHYSTGGLHVSSSG